MIDDPRYLLNYRNGEYSLEGEEGILEYIVNKIPKNERDNFIVEFGACDGIVFSNSLHFIKNLNFEAIEIEPDEIQFESLVKNMKPYNVECIKTFVTKYEDNILDNSNKHVPINFDILVMDVDNNDIHLWETIKKYKPKILMVEINNTLLPTEDKVAQYDAEFIFGKHGSSIKSMTEVAQKKGYKLICNISCNAIYIDAKYYNLFFKNDYHVEDFYTFEGFNIKRWFFELSLFSKIRKFEEATRRDKVLYNLNKFTAFIHIIINIFTKNKRKNRVL